MEELQILNPMTEFELWVYRGVIGVLLLLVWWVVRKAITNMESKFDSTNSRIERVAASVIKISDSVNDAVSQIKIRDERMSNMMKLLDTHDVRINDHSARIRNIEISVCDRDDCPIQVQYAGTATHRVTRRRKKKSTEES